MSRPVFLGAGVGLGVGAGATLLVLGTRSTAVPEARLDELSASSSGLRRRAGRYGLPTREGVLEREGYLAAYDARNRNPLWVLEHLTRDTVRGDGTRDRSEFREDADVDERFRASNEDFLGSGYDRGHLAPAANHKGSQRAMDDTFLLTNVSPQAGAGFNRHYWARFEKFVRDLAWQYDEVFVVTGPLYLPRQRPDGGYEVRFPVLGAPPRMVSVPTHFFKVVLAERRGEDPPGKKGARKRRALGAFVMPNEPIAPGTPLAAFAVPLDSLETTAGMTFFPRLGGDRVAADDVALAWQRAGKALAKEQGKALPPGGGGAGGGGPGPGFSGPRGGGGGTPVAHLCDSSRCELPPENFWLKGKQGAAASRPRARH